MWGQSVIFRIALMFAITVSLCGVASAYTVVMRDGRRIEIPAQFIVTPYTLTYEVSPGIQVTLHMKTIDVGATERANSEPAGALMKRAESVPVPARVAAATPARTITNRDLEQTAKRRQQSELVYDKRIQQMGLPSVAESRARAAAESEVISAELKETVSAEQQREDYWRTRATEMRTEMAVLDAEIAYVRARIEEMPAGNWGSGYSSFTTILPLGSFGVGGGRIGGFGGRNNFPAGRGHRAGVYSPRVGFGPQLSGRVNLGRGSTRAGIFINPRHSSLGRFTGSTFGNRGIVGIPPFGVFPSIGVSDSYPVYDSYERSELITRFNELSSTRAGLRARWRELEEEARRAGAPPGWLRE